jgi:hypothetical protein
MRARFVFGLAAAMVLANAVPAMATSWDVCFKPAAVESGGDLNVSTEGETVGTTVLPIFFSTVVYVYPAGTFQPSTKAPRTSCTTNTAPVGTFLAKAGLVANLPTAISGRLPYVYYVDWHFKIIGKGQFGTSGFVESGNPGVTFSQIVTGSSGGVSASGPAIVLVVSNAGDKFKDTVDIYRITVP